LSAWNEVPSLRLTDFAPKIDDLFDRSLADSNPAARIAFGLRLVCRREEEGRSVGVAGSSQIDHTRPLVRGVIVAGLNPERTRSSS